MPRAVTTRHAILGLLALRPAWSTWELTGQLRRNMRFFWPRAESRIYDEVRALVDQGLATSTVTRTGRRPRTIYRITTAGRRHLREWLATEPGSTRLECEPVLRILLGRLASEAQLRQAVEQVRTDAHDILAVGRVVAEEYRHGAAPFQDDVAYRALVFDFLSHHALTMLAWADRADIAIGRIGDEPDAEAARAAVAEILRIRATYPHAEPS